MKNTSKRKTVKKEIPAAQIMVRKGYIVIAAEVVEKNYEILAKTIFSRFVPLSIQSHPENKDIFMYSGLCADFDEVEATAPVPRYLANVDMGSGGHTATFTRADVQRSTT